MLPMNEYYYQALNSIPENHPHRDEVVSLLIDQVIDDTDLCLHHPKSMNKSN